MPLLSLTGEQAFANLRANRASLWPDGRRDRTRLSGVADVSVKPGFRFEPGESIFTVGSCFARNIEKRLSQLGFDVPACRLSIPAEERASDTENDFLNKYPPQSILNELRWALDPRQSFPKGGLLALPNNLWHDPHLAPNLKPASKKRVLERRALAAELYGQLPKCRIVVMTLGLVEAWFDRRTDHYLNGAPPNPCYQAEPDRFRLDVFTPGEVHRTLIDIHDLLAKFGHPDFRILLTVSPVPFRNTFTGQDAISANTYSKSVLRAAAEMFVRAHPRADYFPSYEVVTHTARSSAYIQDNRHVTPQTVDVIVDRVVAAYCPELLDIQPLDSVLVGASALETQLAMKAGDFTRAAQIFASLEATDGFTGAGYDEFGFRYDYGRVLLRTGAIPDAQAQLSRAAELNPSLPDVHHQLGRALTRLQRPLEAEESFRRAAEISPDNPAFRISYGNQLAELDRFEEAEREIMAALAQAPEDVRALAALDTLKERMKLKPPSRA